MFKFTFQAVRDSLGYTIEEVAEHCSVLVAEMKKFENDPGIMPVSMVIKLRKLYGIPIDYLTI